MDTEPLLASCLMPTCNRRSFVPRAIRQFLEQDYPSRELIVLDDGSDAVGDLLPDDPRIRYARLERRCLVGEKRNLAAEMARGEILVHWDDDDWMAPWRLSYQVRRLVESEVDACGLVRLFFYAPDSGQAWEFTYSGREPWLAGGTLCYTRSFWQSHRFASVREGEDNDFLWRHRPRVLVLPDADFYVATIHSANTSKKRTSAPQYRPIGPEELPLHLPRRISPNGGGPVEDLAVHQLPPGAAVPPLPRARVPLGRPQSSHRAPGLRPASAVIRRVLF